MLEILGDFARGLSLLSKNYKEQICLGGVVVTIQWIVSPVVDVDL